MLVDANEVDIYLTLKYTIIKILEALFANKVLIFLWTLHKPF